MKKVVLIGGAPVSGKSYFARSLSEELKLPWISTDDIREWMRKVADTSRYAELSRFTYEEGAAERYLSSHTPQQIVTDQNIESGDVWKGVEAFIEVDYVWKKFIVEGVAVLPEFVSKTNIEGIELKPLFLIDEDEERIRKIVYKRGVWDDADKYSDTVKEVEVQWVLLFNKWLKEESDKYGYRTIISGNNNFKGLLLEIKEWLKK